MEVAGGLAGEQAAATDAAPVVTDAMVLGIVVLVVVVLLFMAYIARLVFAHARHSRTTPRMAFGLALFDFVDPRQGGPNDPDVHRDGAEEDATFALDDPIDERRHDLSGHDHIAEAG